MAALRRTLTWALILGLLGTGSDVRAQCAPAHCTSEDCRLQELACARATPALLAMPSLTLSPWLWLELQRARLLVLHTSVCNDASCRGSRGQASLAPRAGIDPSLHGHWALGEGRALTVNLTPTPRSCAPLLEVTF